MFNSHHMKRPDSERDIAEYVYKFSDYPDAYANLVSLTRAKMDHYKDIIQAIVGQLGERLDGKTILEIGAGPVKHLESIGSKPGNKPHIVYVDRYISMMSDVAEQYKPSETQADISDLPFYNETFDCIVISSVLLFVPDRNKAILECSRVLKQGGIIIISELDASITAGKLLRKIWGYELRSMWENVLANDSISPLLKVVTYLKLVYARVMALYPHIKVSSEVNRKIVNGGETASGFNFEDLVALLRESGLTISGSTSACSKTYADTYFLIIGAKPIEQ